MTILYIQEMAQELYVIGKKEGEDSQALGIA